MKITQFTGINNVQSAERLLPDARKGTSALAEATNCDIGLDRELMRRQGLTRVRDEAHAWVWEGSGFVLAVVDGDLVSIVGSTETVLHADVGTDRMWYWNWPDGRTAYTNGTVAGLARADGVTLWGNPNPLDAGAAAANDDGTLHAGSYQWAISYVRTSDGHEGGLTPNDSAIVLTEGQGVDFTDLPQLAGYSINVYLTHADGEVFKLAGNTDTDAFTFTGGVNNLVRDAMTQDVDAAPAGRLCAFWRGVSLVVDATSPNVLWISKYLEPEHFDLDKGNRIFGAAITLVQPVEAGVFIGTEDELVFLRGTNTGALSYERSVKTSVVLGSGATVPGRYLKRGDGDAGQGNCMLAIANGNIVAGYQDGSVDALTQGVYSADLDEVCATFRLRGDIPQYIAIAL